MPFPPGHYYADGKFVRYADLTTVTEYCQGRSGHRVQKDPREARSRAWKSGCDADAPLGFLLSGGLDSILVCAIAAKLLGKSRSAPLPSAWTWTPSTSSTPVKSPTSSAPSTPRSS